MALVSVSAQAALPPGTSFSFKGKAQLEQVRAGQLTRTIRLNDRTAAPYSYKLGKVLPLINSDTAEERSTEEEQVAAETYKFVELTQFTVTTFSALSPADQVELKKYYAQEKIDLAKGIVTVVHFKFRERK